MSADFVIRGPPLLSSIPETSLGKQIYDSLRKCTDDQIAYIDVQTNERLYYRDLLRLSCKLASSMQNCGYRINDVIAVCSENSNYFFIPVLAALYLGIIVAPLNPAYTQRELLHTAGITKPKIIFCSKGNFNVVKKLADIANYIERIIVLDANEENPLYDTIGTFISKYCDKNFSIETFKPVELDPFNHVAVILCSSGTTGLPKGVMTTHDNISMRLCHVMDPRMHIPAHTLLGILPFFHGYGFMTSIGTIIENNTVVVLKRFEGDLFLGSIEKYKISTLFLVPPLMLFLVKSPEVNRYDLSSVIEITCAGAPLTKEIEVMARERLPNIKVLRQGYGLTEATLAMLLIPIGDMNTGSSGKVVPGMACVIRDTETGRSLGPNQIGELCFKGRMVTKGYYENEEATKSTFSNDGWVFTGDLAYYDEKRYFYIVDRLKELIKYKGFQVAPAELEALLIQLPQIKDVGIVGKLDEEAGELPTAFVVREANSNITEKQIKEYVADQVSRPKQLHGGVYFMEEIPRLDSGKILRRKLREMVTKMKSQL